MLALLCPCYAAEQCQLTFTPRGHASQHPSGPASHINSNQKCPFTKGTPMNSSQPLTPPCPPPSALKKAIVLHNILLPRMPKSPHHHAHTPPPHPYTHQTYWQCPPRPHPPPPPPGQSAGHRTAWPPPLPPAPAAPPWSRGAGTPGEAVAPRCAAGWAGPPAQGKGRECQQLQLQLLHDYEECELCQLRSICRSNET